MKKTTLSVAGSALMALVGCDSGADADLLLENATMVAALSEGEDNAFGEVPTGDVDGAGAEEADGTVGGTPSPMRDCSLAAIRGNVIGTYDENGDGELDEDERQALRDDFEPQRLRRRRMSRYHRWTRLRWIYDADESGDLDEAERQELRNDLETRCLNRQAQLLTMFDVDGDGALDDDEWLAAHQFLVDRFERRREELMAQYDVDGDGELSLEERQVMYDDFRSQLRQHRARLRDQFDTDGSGDLDEAERAAAREVLKTRVRGEHFGDNSDS